MKKILVIDDAEFILESTSTLLRFEGYDVYTAPDGEQGVKMALEHNPDLILCDISMPHLDGYGVLDKLRLHPETTTTPFIFLTAFTEKSNMRVGMEKGADDFLVKPYTRDELIAAIDAQWKKHSNIEKQVQEKVEEVGRSITYVLPHEFRTVLNQVVGSAKYLFNNSEGLNPSDIREYADDILTSSQRLQRITENFLTFIRINSIALDSKARKQLRNFQTDEPAAVALDLASVIAIRYDRIEDLDFFGDYDSISVEIATESFHKLFDELLDNAFKFSNKGEKVYIKTWVIGSELFFSMKNSGRGMSQMQIANIGAYMQFERSLYEQQGVGLGLVIAKRLIELHDGKFDITSDEVSETTIVFSLPCKSIKY